MPIFGHQIKLSKYVLIERKYWTTRNNDIISGYCRKCESFSAKILFLNKFI